MGLESTLFCGLPETWELFPSYSSLWVKRQAWSVWVTVSFGNMDPSTYISQYQSFTVLQLGKTLQIGKENMEKSTQLGLHM